MKTNKTNLSPMQQLAAAAGALAAVLALSVLTGAAFAADATGAPTNADVPGVVVRFAPQSLQTERGTQEVYRRIVSAARAVCPDDNTRDLHAFSVARECQKAAVARAVARIHHTRLAEMAAHDKRI
jgi:UrcA family protein